MDCGRTMTRTAMFVLLRPALDCPTRLVETRQSGLVLLLICVRQIFR